MASPLGEDRVSLSRKNGKRGEMIACVVSNTTCPTLTQNGPNSAPNDAEVRVKVHATCLSSTSLCTVWHDCAAGRTGDGRPR